MAALAQHGAAVLLADGPGRRLHVCGAADRHAGEDLRLRDVGGQYRGQGQQELLQGGDRVLRDEPVPGGGHHHRVHHQIFGPILLQLGRDHPDQRNAGDHAGLHRVGEDICEHAVQLLRQKVRRTLHDALDAGSVLGHQSRHRTGGEHAVGGHGLDICLDTGASAGIGPSDRQCCLHIDASFPDASLH